MSNNIAGFILAAGEGRRLRPATLTRPKALVPFCGVPLLELVASYLNELGLKQTIVNASYQGERVFEACQRLNEAHGWNLHVSCEPKLLNQGGGIRYGVRLLPEVDTFLIHNVDILDNVDYDWFRRQHLDTEDAVLLVSRRQTSRYLLFDHAMRLMGWVNTTTGELRSPYDWVKNPDSAELDMENYRLNIVRGTTDIALNLFAFSGIHSFSPRLFPLMERFPDRFPIIDFYLQTCHRTHIYGCQKDDLRLLDVGKIESLDKAEEFIQDT